jgi:hypothetical protein
MWTVTISLPSEYQEFHCMVEAEKEFFFVFVLLAFHK